MFDPEEEEELELLRQYEGGNDSESEGVSSDQIDSDTEDRILSMVQFGSGLEKKPKVQQQQEPIKPKEIEKKVVEPMSNKKVVVKHAPIDLNAASASSANFSASNELNLDDEEEQDSNEEEQDFSEDEQNSSEEEQYSSEDENDEVDSSEEEKEGYESDESSTEESVPEPTDLPVTRFIDMNEKQYIDDEDTSEEEAELNEKLRQLIDDQIQNRQRKARTFRKQQKTRVCFGCSQPGHEKKDCSLCPECGALKHATYKCPGARYCERCKMRGHHATDCTNKPFRDACSICGITYHNAINCPSLLHVYDGEVKSNVKVTPYCYNCNDKGHYGDECPLLPEYLKTLPSVFSKYSVDIGSRFDPKKVMKSTASTFGRERNSHYRFSSDSSRESSPRSESPHRRKKQKKNYDKPSSSKTSSGLDQMFNRPKYQKFNTVDQANREVANSFKFSGNFNRTGSNNWKNVNDSLPKPTRSGTVNMNQQQQQQQQQKDSGHFTRGNNANSRNNNNSNNNNNNNNASFSRGNNSRNNNDSNNYSRGNNNSNNFSRGNNNNNGSNNFSHGNNNRNNNNNNNRNNGSNNFSHGNNNRNNNSLPRPTSSGIIVIDPPKRAPKYRGGYRR